jgi:hypothetical protein
MRIFWHPIAPAMDSDAAVVRVLGGVLGRLVERNDAILAAGVCLKNFFFWDFLRDFGLFGGVLYAIYLWFWGIFGCFLWFGCFFVILGVFFFVIFGSLEKNDKNNNNNNN